MNLKIYESESCMVVTQCVKKCLRFFLLVENDSIFVFENIYLENLLIRVLHDCYEMREKMFAVFFIG